VVGCGIRVGLRKEVGCWWVERVVVKLVVGGGGGSRSSKAKEFGGLFQHLTRWQQGSVVLLKKGGGDLVDCGHSGWVGGLGCDTCTSPALSKAI
jgi:hypothetical protein